MNQHPNKEDFSLPIVVSKEHIDELGHVNNVVYVQWIQDIAAAHWNTLASVDTRKKYLWVVLRHEIDYLSAAFEGNTLTATTWVGESHGARSERFVQITHEQNGKLIAKAKTLWCLLDGVSMKPKRIDEEVIKILMK